MRTPVPVPVTHFQAVIKAIAVLPGPRYKNLTAEGTGESKPAARVQAEGRLLEQLSALRVVYGPRVVLQFASTPLFEEIDPRA